MNTVLISVIATLMITGIMSTCYSWGKADGKKEVAMIPWREAKTAKATVVDIRECDKIMDQLTEDITKDLKWILMSDSISIAEAQSLISTMIDLAKSKIQSMAEEVSLTSE